MCVIYLAFGRRPDLPLIVAANRDEFYDRPTAAAARWDDEPGIVAGRDLVSGGTWLGVADGGRFAAVTNYRDPNPPLGIRSRGMLVADFLRGRSSVHEYIRDIASHASEFSGFNLLLGEINSDRREVNYFSNRENIARELSPDFYGLSNHLLDTPWPKVSRGKERFKAIVEKGFASNEPMFELLTDPNVAEDEELPDTGVGREKEKILSPIFIKTPIYGTRCSTVVTIDAKGNASLDERTFV
ncbi:MAG TPA: NRDE family protein [Pyrinomonadaceae bacterium]|nr:NRDE family protein [Pyrinomonadaceae bacterium]